MLRTGDIANPAIRAAAIRFERETGRSLADELYDERDEGIIAIFPIVSGYAPELPGFRSSPDDNIDGSAA
ncbi:MAG: hypothetical protein F9K38_10140 [Pseudorhodoplanes sp.]|nr:MAG: hypothetical protein F9K38_10140 [Pseudorhodoplanes sp.]MBZ0227887.1 hypothetical protein [Bauldia sp.]